MTQRPSATLSDAIYNVIGRLMLLRTIPILASKTDEQVIVGALYHAEQILRRVARFAEAQGGVSFYRTPHPCLFCVLQYDSRKHDEDKSHHEHNQSHR
jgi:hypothetical protein